MASAGPPPPPRNLELHGPSHGYVKEVIKLGEKIKFILDKDTVKHWYEVSNNLLSKIMEPYVQMYHDNINVSRQSSITDSFARNPPQLQPAQVSDSEDSDSLEGN